jgi:hypothetical protein
MWLGEAEDDSHLAAELVDTLHGIIRERIPGRWGMKRE